jgi:hypothetical protein
VRVFDVLGTPTKTSWPEWDQLPDSNKMTFEVKSSVEDLQTIGELVYLVSKTLFYNINIELNLVRLCP